MIKGSGLIIGGPYGDDTYNWNTTEVSGNTASMGIEKAEDYLSQGLIDNTENLNNDPVYIFSGELDTTVIPAKQEALKDFYTNYGANIDFVSKADIGHEIPTIFDENNDFTYDMAGDLLSHILTNLETNSIASLNEANADWESAGVLRRFNQWEFVSDVGMTKGKSSGLAKYGYVYYPDECITNQCKVHMHLHGCLDINQGFTKNLYTTYGFHQYAATNDLIVIFP